MIKKLLLLFIFVILFIRVSYASTIYSDTFSDCSVSPTGWTVVSGTWTSSACNLNITDASSNPNRIYVNYSSDVLNTTTFNFSFDYNNQSALNGNSNYIFVFVQDNTKANTFGDNAIAVVIDNSQYRLFNFVDFSNIIVGTPSHIYNGNHNIKVTFDGNNGWNLLTDNVSEGTGTFKPTYNSHGIEIKVGLSNPNQLWDNFLVNNLDVPCTNTLGRCLYVSTSGNNASSGTNITTAWRNISYATQQAVAGDIIYIINDTWLNETPVFANSGNATNPITLTSYNGTSILDGLNSNYTCSGNPCTSRVGITISSAGSAFTHNYINVSNIKIVNYSYGIMVREASNINISNMEIYNTTGSAIFAIDDNNSLIQYNTLHDNGGFDYGGTGDSTIQISTGSYWSHNITILGNIIYDNPGTSKQGTSTGHNAIDLNNNADALGYYLKDINILNNHIFNIDTGKSAVWSHGTNFWRMERVNLSNNIVNGTGRSLNIQYFRNSTVRNNTVSGNTYGLESGQAYGPGTLGYTNISNNTVINNQAGFDIYAYINASDNNVFWRNNTAAYYTFLVGTGTIIDAANISYTARSSSSGTVVVQYPLGYIFSENGANTTRYYPDRSEYITTGNEIVTINKYAIILQPSQNNVTATNTTSRLTVNYQQSTIPRLNFSFSSGIDLMNVTLNNVTSGANYSLYYAGNNTFINSTIAQSPVYFNLSLGNDNYYITEVLPSPNITSWGNDQTNNNTLNITIPSGTIVNFNATANQTITSWPWTGIDSGGGMPGITSSASKTFNTPGIFYVTVTCSNSNGSCLNTINWSVNVTAIVTQNITISCPTGWCFLAMNYTTGKTLLQLDNIFTTVFVDGWYNSTSQKYETHYHNFIPNQNANVPEKWGYYYYFNSPTSIQINITQNPSIILIQGWNLVGNLDSNRTLSTLKTSIGAEATQARHFNYTSQNWQSADTETVQVGESFFVYVTANKTWSG